MSFLSEVLDTYEKVELDTVCTKVPELVIKSKLLLKNVHSFIYKIYVFSSRNEKTDLLDQCIRCKSEIQHMHDRIQELKEKELNTLNEDLLKFIQELEIAQGSIKNAYLTMQVHEDFQTILDSPYVTPNFDKIMKLKKLKRMVAPLFETNKSEEIRNLVYAINMEMTDIYIALEDICKEYLIFEVSTKRSIQNLVKMKRDDAFVEALRALSTFNSRIHIYNDFAEFLWKNIFFNILNFTTRFDTENRDDGYLILVLEVISKNKNNNFSEVVDTLYSVIETLHEHFNIKLNESESTLTYIGDIISERLSNSIIEDLLSHIPANNPEEIKVCEKIAKEVSQLQTLLHTTGIFKAERQTLTEYFGSVENFYLKKKCNIYRALSYAIKRKSLNDTCSVGIPCNFENPEEEILYNQFPLSKVSTSAGQILKLGNELMEKVISSTSTSSEKYYDTLVEIFKLYGESLLEIHKNELKSNPASVAIFYNNCMYISYTLVIWEDNYKNKLPPHMSKDRLQFGDTSLHLRDVANICFNQFLKKQMYEIETLLNEYKSNKIEKLQNLDIQCDTQFRKCMELIVDLKHAWENNLPYKVYTKALGSVLNVVCKYLINIILNLEKIDTTTKTILTNISKYILEKGIDLFPNENSVVEYVEFWNKLEKTMFVLTMDPLMVQNYWENGHLKQYLKADEILKLIKTLHHHSVDIEHILSKIY